MVAALPASVECRVAGAGYGESRERAVREFVPDVGRPIRSKRQTIAHEMIDGTLYVSRAAMDDFWAFWTDDIGCGIDVFTMPHPRTHDTITVEFVNVDPPKFDRRTIDRYEAPFSVRVIP